VLCRSLSTSPSCTRSLHRSLRRRSLPSRHSVKWGLGFRTGRLLGFVSPKIGASRRILMDERDEMGCPRSPIHAQGEKWAATVWAHPAILWVFFHLGRSACRIAEAGHASLWAASLLMGHPSERGQISFYFPLILFVIYKLYKKCINNNYFKFTTLL
jgi:hypothetical protein